MSNPLNKIPKFDVAKSKNIIIIVAVIVVIFIIVKFGSQLSNSIGGLFGNSTDPLVQAATNNINAADVSSANPSSPFSPQLYNNNPDASTLDYSTLQSMANAINDSVSWLPNIISPADALAGLSAIKQCNNQVDVSNLTVVFQQMFGKDLYSFMSSNYTSSQGVQEFSQIINFVKSLPTT